MVAAIRNSSEGTVTSEGTFHATSTAKRDGDGIRDGDREMTVAAIMATSNNNSSS
ncbi:hypothetical protein EV182_005325, partial [Spiromyces aspiralis]